MSVKIDGKELGQYFAFAIASLGARIEYRGKALENNGLILERWLRQYSEGIVRSYQGSNCRQ